MNAAHKNDVILGLFLFAVAIVLILESKLGLSPWDVLHQGIAKSAGISIGVVPEWSAWPVKITRNRLGAAIDVTRPMRFCFASAAFAAGLSAALSIAAPAASAQTAPLNPRVALKVGAIGAVSDAGIFIAQEKGYFNDEGLDVAAHVLAHQWRRSQRRVRCEVLVDGPTSKHVAKRYADICPKDLINEKKTIFDNLKLKIKKSYEF